MILLILVIIALGLAILAALQEIRRQRDLIAYLRGRAK